MEFRVLGPLRAVDDDGAVLPVSGQQGRLLACLLVSANTTVTPDRLVHLLWADDPPPSAMTSLHAHISRLRRRLGLSSGSDVPPVLETSATGYRLRIDRAQVDATRFERLVAGAREYLHRDPERAGAGLETALEMWDGPAYGEFAGEPFAVAEATRLNEARLDAFEHRIDARLRSGQHTDVVAQLERHVLDNPLRERACGQLMLALYRCARQADALEIYRDLRERLADDLGLEPSTDLRRLEGDILRQSPSLEWRPAGGGGLRHAVHGTVLAPATTFVGRRADVAAVVDILRRVRLLTLIGVGGVGKTRLARRLRPPSPTTTTTAPGCASWFRSRTRKRSEKPS